MKTIYCHFLKFRSNDDVPNNTQPYGFAEHLKNFDDIS